MTDKDGLITFINPEFTKMYGYTKEEVVGKVTPRILKSGDIDNIDYDKNWDALLNKQSLPNAQYRNKTKDDNLIDIEASADPILDDNGEIIGFLGIQRNNSERKRAELIQKVILNISNASQIAGDLGEIMEIIQTELSRLIDTKNCFVALYDEETDRIHLPYFQDEKDHVMPEVESIFFGKEPINV